MHTVTIGGKEYILRCDLNVVEQIEEKLGSIEEARRNSGSASVLKFLVTAMINEHFNFVGSPERVTENFVGTHMTVSDRVPAMSAVIACFAESFESKNV